MKTRALPLVVLALASAALLSACGGSVLTASAEQIADTAENGLEETVGTRPDMDCGTGDITLKVGLVVDCTLTDPESGEQFDAPVTIESIEGTTYTVGVKVADAPIDSPEPEPTVEPDATTGDPTVPAADIAELAEGALEGVLSARPNLDCGSDDVAISVGNTVACTFDEDGVTHDVVVEITEFDGSSYTINAEITN